jgi:hypothetical protein
MGKGKMENTTKSLLLEHTVNTNIVKSTIETGNIAKLRSTVLQEARNQISSESGEGWEGQVLQAHIYYRAIGMLAKYDMASFIVKAMFLEEIEKNNLWSALPDVKSPEQAAWLETKISPSEYSNIKDIWQIIIPYAKKIGISVERILSVPSSSLRMAIPVLKEIIREDSTQSKKVKLRAEQLISDAKEIHEDPDIEPELFEAEIRAMAFEDILINAESATNSSLRDKLDPYIEENTRGNDVPRPIYPAVIYHKNGQHYIIIEVDQDGLNTFNPTLEKHCDVFHLTPPDSIIGYPIIKAMLNGKQ